MKYLYGILGTLLIMGYVAIPCEMDPSHKVIVEDTLEVYADTVREPIQSKFNVTLTCYQPLMGQCEGNPLVTSDGSRIDLEKLKNGELRWVAVSRDILAKLPKEKKKRIFIEGYGEFEVHDTMHKRWKNRVDILIHPTDTERINGKNVGVYVLY